MRLLLTRAAENAARTGAVLEQAGHQVLLSPVLRYASTGEALPHRVPGGIVATSARAFVGCAAPSWDMAAPRLYLVGGRTEAAARANGFEGQAVVVPTGAALADVLRNCPAMRLLYLAGVDRKADLEEALAGLEHRLEVVETYEAEAATTLSAEAETALRNGEIDAVLHYSRRSAEIFTGLCQAADLDHRAPLHLCLSLDVAGALGGFPRVRVAAAPEEAALVALVEDP